MSLKIVRITKTEDGFDVKTFGEFKQVVSEYCFQTHELVGQKLCYLTTASWFTKGGESRCNHSSIKTISVTKCKEKCPHTPDALVAYAHCEGGKKRLESLLSEEDEELTNVLRRKTIEKDETCKVRMQLKGNSDWQDYETSHYNLCEYNGVVRLGSLQSGFKHVDCKEVQTISIQAETESENQNEDRFNLSKCKHDSPCNKKNSSFQQTEGNYLKILYPFIFKFHSY